MTIRRFRGRALEWALVAIAALALAVPLTGEDSITAGTQNGIVDLHSGLGDYAVDPDRGISEYGDIPRTGKTRAHPTILTTKSLLIYGEGRAGGALLHAVSKKTGEEIAQVEIPAPTNTAPMTYMHEGRQYIVLSVAGRGHAAEHVVLTLPEE